MKTKIIMVLFACILMTGCSQKEVLQTETQDQGYISKLNSLNSSSTQAMENASTTEQKTLPNHEDLGVKYKQAILKTNFGDITIEFYYEDSPITVNNFLNLAQSDFYDGTLFHRVIKDFMIQGGDPNSKNDDWSSHGSGGPEYRFADEINDKKLVRGSLAMANSNRPVTNGSQFFIVTTGATPWLDGKHTNFGKVVSGMDVVDKIGLVETNKNDHPEEDVIIKDVVLVE